jgi:formate dehydrogenase subunit gamma
MGNRQGWNADLAENRIQELRRLPGALLFILHSLQEEFGCIDEAAVPLIACALNISQAEVHRTISFYPDFRRPTPGRHVLKVCRAEACQSMGCDSLIEHIQNRLRIPVGGTTEDGRITLEQIFCLGMCASSPALMLDDRPYARVSRDIADSLIDNVLTRL